MTTTQTTEYSPQIGLLCPICSTGLVPSGVGHFCRQCYKFVQSQKSKQDWQPRPVHYMFAHCTLRKEAYENTDALITALRSLDYNYLKRLWLLSWLATRLSTDDTVDTTQQPEFPSEIDIRIEERGAFTCYLIEMPKALRPTEAIFIGVVQDDDGKVSYYTLEKTLSCNGKKLPPVFCMWGADGAHSNYGQILRGTADVFVESVFSHLEQT